VNNAVASGDANAPVSAATGAATLDASDRLDVPAEPAAVATWPSSQSSIGPTGDGEQPSVEAVADASPADTDASKFAEWPASTWGAAPAPSAEPGEPAETVEPDEPVQAAAESPLAVPTADAPLAEPSPDDAAATADAPVTDEAEPGDSAPATADEFAWWAAPTTDAPAVADEPAWFTREQATDAPAATSRPSAAWSASSVADADLDGDPSLDRAYDLLDELRGIITAFATQPPSATAAIDVDGAVAELTAARDAGGPSADEGAAFREVLAAARAEPNNIRSVLGLVDHLETIAALQDAYDRYASAVDRALAGLHVEE
jgi:hypothetical protein